MGNVKMQKIDLCVIQDDDLHRYFWIWTRDRQ